MSKHDIENWQKEIRMCLSNLADLNQQQSAWSSNGRIYFPDAIELCVRLLDDAEFSRFLEQVTKPLNYALYLKGAELIEVLQSISDEDLKTFTSLLKNPSWQRAAALSNDILRAL
jgi:hypothetical protein